MSTSVKHFHSGMVGAPVLSGTAGAMIAVLDACLLTGFGLQTVTTLVVSGGVATLTVPTTPSAQVGTVVLVAGATPAGLNGEQRVTAVAGNSISFATALADGTATGTITVKLAPAGWAKLFAGTNLAAYKPTDPSATGCVLRVDDTATTTCRVRGFESMSDVSTGLGLFPTDAQFSGGMYWGKSNTANTTARPWWVYADGRTFYILALVNLSAPLFGFGDILSNKSGDAYSCFLTGDASNITSNVGGVGPCLGYGAEATGSLYLPRSHTGIGGSVQARKRGALNTAPGYTGSSTYNSDGLVYPNGPDNALVVTPVHVIAASSLRGTLPGLLHTPLQVGASFNTADQVMGTGPYSGRKLHALRTGAPASSAVYGTAFMDATGPWR